jgi:cytochrome c556
MVSRCSILTFFSGGTSLFYRICLKSKTTSAPVLASRFNRHRDALLSSTLALCVLGSANARVPQIAHARRNQFHALGKANKALRDEIGRSHPNWRLVATEANQIESLAVELPSWFPAGSGKSPGNKTRARVEVWTSPQAFAQAAQRLLERSKDVTRAAANEDLRRIRLDARGLGEACASCHRGFRAHSSWW